MRRQGSRSRRLPCPALALCALLAVSACGTSGTSGARTGGGRRAPSGPQASLRVSYWPHGEGASGARVWTLTCRPEGGDHPKPAAACAELASEPDPFAPPREPCSLAIKRGAPSAMVTGSYRGRAVTAVVRPGCGTAWTRLHVLLTGA